ncbi:MAG: hypothetical protein GY792_36365 [Gammaproteobacteria bacterium]|nr:hypothetical protein [Gammaproteobacteria bacterium]
MSLKMLGTILTTLCIAALISTNAYATDCKTLCSDAGYSSHYADGTAPFCGGQCNNGFSGDSALWENGTGYIYCAGSCSDGKGCLSGSKQCNCWNPIDCEAECTKKYTGTAQCTTHISVTGPGASNPSLSIIGACGWDYDDKDGVEQCYCDYSGSTDTGF